MKSEHKSMMLIFGLAISLRLLLFIAIGPWQEKVLEEEILIWDAAQYHQLAVNLLENGVFSKSESFPYESDTFRTPIYPLFIAAVYLIFGYKPYVAMIFDHILGALTCILTYKTAKLYFDEKIAIAAGLFLAVEHIGILYVICS